MINWGILREILLLVLTNGLPMVGVFWFMERPFVTRWFERLAPHIQNDWGLSVKTVKRLTALVLAVVVSTPLYVLTAAFGYVVMPHTVEEWLNVIISLGLINFGGSTTIHGFKLPKETLSTT